MPKTQENNGQEVHTRGFNRDRLRLLAAAWLDGARAAWTHYSEALGFWSYYQEKDS